MTPADLTELDRLLHISEANFLDALDKLVTDPRERERARRGGMLYQVPSAQPGDPQDGVNKSTGQVIELMSLAGLPHDLGAPAQRRAPHPNPAVQLLACLEVMHDDIYTLSLKQYGDTSAIKRMCIEHMHDLLMAHPVLMHPRILWQYQRISAAGRTDAALPLLHDYIVGAHWSLPTANDRFSEAARRAWARHPALTAAMTTPAPGIVGRGNHNSERKLYTNAFLSPAKVGHAVRLESLLKLERFRVAPEDGAAPMAPTLDAGADPRAVLTLLRLFGDELWATSTVDLETAAQAASLETHPARSIPRGLEAMRELLIAPSLTRRDIDAALLVDATSIYREDPFATPNLDPVPTNAVARLHQYIRTLVTLGVARDTAHAARRVVNVLFGDTGTPVDGQTARAGAGRPVPGSGAAQMAEGLPVELAQRLLQEFVGFGVDLDLLTHYFDTYQAIHKTPFPSFAQACAALDTEATMSAVISESIKAARDAQASASSNPGEPAPGAAEGRARRKAL